MKKIIRLDIDYPHRVLKSDSAKPATSQQISVAIINHAMIETYGQAQKMNLKQLRMWSKIQDRIEDDGGEPVVGDVELSEEQFSFLFDTLSEAKYPPGFAIPVALFMDHIEAVKLGKDEPEKPV